MKRHEVITYDIPTEKGAKKDTSQPLPDAYSPQYVEAAWGDWWIEQGFFKPEFNHPDVKNLKYEDKFIIMFPPPNVTGCLHLGHAITLAIEDALCRWHRMKGKAVLWVPGCDHAGIATQVVVEKKLEREQNKTRHDLGREAFLQEVWKWKNEKGHRIYDQLRQLGGSFDWSRVAFTMDEKLYRAVTEAFCRLHDRGLIYRSQRLVNWCCTLNSAISNEEVDKLEIKGRTQLSVPGYKEKVEFGVLTSFAYKVCDSEEEIVVATTRIETMLGDTGVAVHPKDQRYVHLHGKSVRHPFITDRILPIVTDDFVDMKFGTGVVKITPGHDQIDFEVGERHGLRLINILDSHGNLNENCDQFAGMKRFHGRKAVLQALKDKGLYRGEVDNQMELPICSRSNDVIEPLIKPQWYVDVGQMSDDAIKAVREGDVKIIPSKLEDTWHKWLLDHRPWCISRQLWWGHRVPAYFVVIEGQPEGKDIDGTHWVSGRCEAEAREKAAQKFNVDVSKITLIQDEDVLDTWFSSALFPFSVFGWPDLTDDLQAFYPGTLLETGSDIIYFWVARMVMMGITLLGERPFKHVFLHSLIRDAHGRKMSKSLGNVIDPSDIIQGIELQELNEKLVSSNLDSRELNKALEGQRKDFPNGIPECGVDALRFALLAYTQQGTDINLDVKRVEGYRFFCNKLWQTFRFSLPLFESDFVLDPAPKVTGKESVMDKWILSRLAYAIQTTNIALGSYEFSVAAKAVYDFWWHNLSGWYLEHVKIVLKKGDAESKIICLNILYTCLDQGLRLLHPFMPFITEELYQRLPRRGFDNAPSICVSSFPEVNEAIPVDTSLEAKLSLFESIVESIRRVKSAHSIAHNTKVEAWIHIQDEWAKEFFQQVQGIVTAKSVASCLTLIDDPSRIPPNTIMDIVSTQCKVFINGVNEIDWTKEIARLQTIIAGKQESWRKIKEDIANPDYISKVPLAVRQERASKITNLETEMELLDDQILTLKSKHSN